MLYVMPFLLAMAVTMLWLPVFARYAIKWGIIDVPAARKVHLNPIPRIGGLAMAIGVLVAAVIVIPLQSTDWYFLAAGGIVALFGGLDDRFDLHYRIKLAAQVIAAFVVVVGGGVEVHALVLDDRVSLPQFVSIPLTLFFVVGVTNAINLADGLDGLAGGTTFLSLCAIAMLCYSSGEVSSAALALAFAGAILGFLRFNTFPASIFMGDAGSQLLGFTVAVLSIRATQSSHSVISAAIPVLLLALPILDTLSVMTQRLSEGRSPFSADKNHIHHKLLAFGFDHHEAVIVIYAVQADLFLLAYWMRFESDLAILGAVTLFFVASVALLQSASRRHWRFRPVEKDKTEPPMTRIMTILQEPEHLPRWSYLIVSISVAGYALLVTSETRNFSLDVRLLLISLMVISVVCLALLRRKPLNAIEKGALYVTAAILVNLDVGEAVDQSSMLTYTWAAIFAMGAGTVLRVRLSKDRRFELTPLDLIVLFVALVIPSLPDSFGLPAGGAFGIAKLVILFYAIEVLVNRAEMRAVWLRVATVSLLAGLIIRPMM